MHRTTILVNDETRERLKELGRKGQSYDELINQLLEIRRIQLKDR